jgi:hypothetical protein
LARALVELPEIQSSGAMDVTTLSPCAIVLLSPNLHLFLRFMMDERERPINQLPAAVSSQGCQWSNPSCITPCTLRYFRSRAPLCLCIIVHRIRIHYTCKKQFAFHHSFLRLSAGDELYLEMVDMFWSGSNVTFPLSSNQAPSSLIRILSVLSAV